MSYRICDASVREYNIIYHVPRPTRETCKTIRINNIGFEKRNAIHSIEDDRTDRREITEGVFILHNLPLYNPCSNGTWIRYKNVKLFQFAAVRSECVSTGDNNTGDVGYGFLKKRYSIQSRYNFLLLLIFLTPSEWKYNIFSVRYILIGERPFLITIRTISYPAKPQTALWSVNYQTLVRKLHKTLFSARRFQ